TTTTPPPATVAPSTNTTVGASIPSSSLRWVNPNNGPVIQGFNLANNVKGIRYGGNQGDPIYAAADGQVVYAADGLKEYGNLVLIKHIDGYISAYAHNSKMMVKSGDNVTAGQKIAEMGSSGASRVMLEFQIRLDGKPINPANLLPN
ncbi:murein hydrolase activator EnvC family protein, partial [Acinetobacter baumannii]